MNRTNFKNADIVGGPYQEPQGGGKSTRLFTVCVISNLPSPEYITIDAATKEAQTGGNQAGTRTRNPRKGRKMCASSRLVMSAGRLPTLMLGVTSSCQDCSMRRPGRSGCCCCCCCCCCCREASGSCVQATDSAEDQYDKAEISGRWVGPPGILLSGQHGSTGWGYAAAAGEGASPACTGQVSARVQPVTKA